MLATDKDIQHLAQELTAARKRLSTPEAKLTWFLTFAEDDLANLSPSELSIVNYNLLGATLLDAATWPRESPVELMKLDLLRKIQRQIRDAIHTLFSLELPLEERPAEGDWKTRGPDFVGVKRISPIGAKETKLETYNWTKARDRYILHGFLLTLQIAGESLRTCARCGKPFVRVRRQEYCSPECSQIVRNDKKKKLKAKK
jgi:hypothetical protein